MPHKFKHPILSVALALAFALQAEAQSNLPDPCSGLSDARQTAIDKEKQRITDDKVLAELQRARAVKKECLIQLTSIFGTTTGTPNTGIPFLPGIMNRVVSGVQNASCNAITSAANSALRKADSTVGSMTGGVSNGLISNSVSGVNTGDINVNTDSIVNGLANKSIDKATNLAVDQAGTAVRGVTGSGSSSVFGNVTSSIGSSTASGVGSEIRDMGSTVKTDVGVNAPASSPNSLTNLWNNLAGASTPAPVAP